MSTRKTKRQQPIAAAPSAPHQLSERFADPDLVDRLFDYVVQLLPELADRAPEVKAAVRDEFAGAQVYIREREAGHELARKVLTLFNGRNASEVARQLNISRATVYRYLKQPGRRAG